METAQVLPKTKTVDQVRVFKALSDGTRLKILELLATKGELCVCFIYDELKMSQPRISRHLGILRDSGLVTHRPDGSWVYYRINPEKLEEVTSGFTEMCEKIHKPVESVHCD